MNAIIRKAVFPVAGFGTRFLPVTKAMPKELLPVVNKPLIQYAAEEAIAAGCDTLIFVTGRNKRAVEDHFDSNLELEAALRAKGKHAEAESLRNIVPPHVKCIFVRQPKQLGLGHAVLCAERAIGNEPFTVLLADDFIKFDGRGVTAELISAFNKSNKNQLSVMKVNGPEISKYGVVVLKDDNRSVSNLIEKPKYIDAPSNLASIGRYVLTPKIFDVLRNQKIGLSGEIQLADAVNTIALKNDVEAMLLNGTRFDCGSIKGYVDAIKYMSDKVDY